jgi:O-antigen/teichoic acid export membrane protein
LSSLKNLAGQTAIYGVTNILGRLLNYLLVPLYTAVLSPRAYFPVTVIYAWIPFLSVIFTYGMETSFFRFSQNQPERKKVLSASSISLVISTLFFTFLLINYRHKLALWMDLGDHPEYIIYFALILAFDTLTAIPFANLRLQNRPMRYSIVKLVNIMVNIGLNIFFLIGCPWMLKHNITWVSSFYDPSLGVHYIFISNLVASGITMLFLLPEILGIQWKIDKDIWERMIQYSMPLIIVGLAGMVNETLDRAFFLPRYLPYSTEQNQVMIGIYGANYKLSILITLFIQAFRMGAEPFFFQNAEAQNAKQTYARVMKYFVIILSIMFLFVSMYISVWKLLFLRQEVYWQGLYVVPTLLLANIFLGIYYNLSIWFKLSNQTTMGAYITVVTAILAFILNIWWIPILGYYGSALATMVCYGVQMCICYRLGQKYYPIPYATKKLFSIILLALLFYGAYWCIIRYLVSPEDVYALNAGSLAIASGLLGLYIYLMYKIEKPYLKNVRLPIIGKLVK